MAKRASSRVEPGIPRAANALKGRELRLRRQRVRLLQTELEKARERVRVLERELRGLGEPEAIASAGRIRWGDLFDQLGDSFTANELSAITGASPGHVGTVAHGWRAKGWIVTSGRGVYQKKTPRSRT